MKSEPINVSIVIPAYNQARYLSQAIDSALAQTYRDFEIIVIDDGSTDETAEVAKSYGDQIRYLYQSNLGLAGARNTGIRAARGEFIGLLDSDDLWMPDYLAEMLALSKAQPEAAVYYCRAQCMDAGGDDLPQRVGWKPVDPGHLHQQVLRANFLIPSTILMRRSIVVDHGYFDQTLRFCEDWDLWLRILPKHTFAGTPKVLVRYRIHGTSLSTNSSGTQNTKLDVAAKHYGPDDANYASWTTEKRYAYGGAYRFQLLSFTRLQNDWLAATTALRRALKADPSLAEDLDLFYELGIGAQPPGYRGVVTPANLEEIAAQLVGMLQRVFSVDADKGLHVIRPTTYGTAYYALGLLAYTAGFLKTARRYLVLALRYRPDLWRDPMVTGQILKTFLGQNALTQLRHLRRSNG